MKHNKSFLLITTNKFNPRVSSSILRVNVRKVAGRKPKFSDKKKFISPESYNTVSCYNAIIRLDSQIPNSINNMNKAFHDEHLNHEV